MMRKSSIVIPLVILWCSLVSPEPGTGLFAGVYFVMPNFEFRESEKKIDRIAPSAPSVSVRQIWRGQGLVKLGENMVGSSAGDHGSISFQLAGAKDNRTPADSLGYRAHFVDGVLPDGLAKIPPGPFGPLRRSIMYFGWTDGATWDQEPFSFRFYVTAVDWAGNESAPSDTILVEHNGDTSHGRKLATRTARSSFDTARYVHEADSLSEIPFTDLIREYFEALAAGQAEHAHNLLSPAVMALTNADSTKVEFPARPPFETFRNAIDRWKGMRVVKVQRIQPFSADEGEASELLGIREYRVRLEKDSKNERERYGVGEAAAVRGTDGRIRLVRANW